MHKTKRISQETRILNVLITNNICGTLLFFLFFIFSFGFSPFGKCSTWCVGCFFFFFFLLSLLAHVMCRLSSTLFFQFLSAKKRASDMKFKILYLLYFKSIFNVPYTDLKLITYRFIIWNHISQIKIILEQFCP